MSTTNITVRIDTELKKQAEELFYDFGMNMTTAYVMFLKQAVREQRIPFEISRNTPNAETIAAIEEVRAMKADPTLGKSYTDVDEMMRELLS
ncbi:MAG: type II toxin-antitoxin system RelB/DinJ family antitoxin [Oscillospiraceae bacterium]|jgi:DNA-damage-inducible protein J|nr:type II toxin-antitoxin system RelB/DinJ family antitoxin [Oscillospiraceae bacterium]